ncbi:hypothetical protein CIK05_13875 [Bdellovibrio sp. qaytius]|nr:hypothetical protein CIK05_13875 [Bdellovibrio sp. qaytius]
MKKQNIYQLSMLVLTAMAVSSCSPFGNQSLVQDIANEIGVFIPKVSSGVNSSASSTVTITCGNGGLPQMPCPGAGSPSPDVGLYTVTHSVGDTYQAGNSSGTSVVDPTVNPSVSQQPTASGTATPTGYTVFSSVSGEVQ